jgi:ParB family chromosome partitioning protein
LSVGHAKVILGIAGDHDQNMVAERVIKDGLNVRQTEGLVAKLQSRGQKPDGEKKTGIVPVSSNISRLEDKLREKFGTKVRLKYAQGKGALEVSFFSDDELQRVLEVLQVTAD